MSFQSEITLENRTMGYTEEDAVKIGSEPGLNFITLRLSCGNKILGTQFSAAECQHLIEILQTAARIAHGEKGASL